jgi:hypothetical protein
MFAVDLSKPVGCERQQRHLSGALDRICHHALVLGARAGYSPGVYFATVRDEALKQVHLLVINMLSAVGTELAYSLAPTESTAARLSSRPA